MRRLRQLTRAWNGFWFAEASPVALAVFRIAFSLLLASELSNSYERNWCAPGGTFRLPYTSWLGPLPDPLYGAAHWIQLPLIALLGLGLAVRPACALLLAVQGAVFFCDQLNYRNHPYFFMLVLLLLMVSPCDEALSLRGLRRRLPARAPLAAQRLLQVQVSIVYFFAALFKCNRDFLAGIVLSGYFARNLLEGFSGRVLGSLFSSASLEAALRWLEDPSHLVAVSWATVATEFALSVGLWWRRTRPLAMVVGLGFHLQIALLMSIWEFSAAMIASYVLFLEPDAVAAALGRLRGTAARLRAPRGPTRGWP